jgi:hypothetical protein
MAMLGDILAAASRSSGVVDGWLEADHPDLYRRVAAAAATEATSASGFARIAVADFSRDAGEEDWASLVSRLRGGTDPGTACLHAILEWRLGQRADAGSSKGS